jgi:ABC-type multidrug transport system ATPase subunit
MIEFNNVTFGYRKNVLIIDGVTISVGEGQTLGLLGHNGAGKTSTLRLILGILQPRTGCVRVGDCKPGSKDMPRNFICYMPESIGIYDRLTGFQNLEFRARVARVIPDRIHAKSEELLRRNLLLGQ